MPFWKRIYKPMRLRSAHAVLVHVICSALFGCAPDQSSENYGVFSVRDGEYLGLKNTVLFNRVVCGLSAGQRAKLPEILLAYPGCVTESFGAGVAVLGEKGVNIFTAKHVVADLNPQGSIIIEFDRIAVDKSALYYEIPVRDIQDKKVDPEAFIELHPSAVSVQDKTPPLEKILAAIDREDISLLDGDNDEPMDVAIIHIPWNKFLSRIKKKNPNLKADNPFGHMATVMIGGAYKTTKLFADGVQDHNRLIGKPPTFHGELGFNVGDNVGALRVELPSSRIVDKRTIDWVTEPGIADQPPLNAECYAESNPQHRRFLVGKLGPGDSGSPIYQRVEDKVVLAGIFSSQVCLDSRIFNELILEFTKFLLALPAPSLRNLTTKEALVIFAKVKKRKCGIGFFGRVSSDRLGHLSLLNDLVGKHPWVPEDAARFMFTYLTLVASAWSSAPILLLNPKKIPEASLRIGESAAYIANTDETWSHALTQGQRFGTKDWACWAARLTPEECQQGASFPKSMQNIVAQQIERLNQ